MLILSVSLSIQLKYIETIVIKDLYSCQEGIIGNLIMKSSNVIYHFCKHLLVIRKHAHKNVFTAFINLFI